MEEARVLLQQARTLARQSPHSQENEIFGRSLPFPPLLLHLLTVPLILPPPFPFPLRTIDLFYLLLLRPRVALMNKFFQHFLLYYIHYLLIRHNPGALLLLRQ